MPFDLKAENCSGQICLNCHKASEIGFESIKRPDYTAVDKQNLCIMASNLISVSVYTLLPRVKVVPNVFTKNNLRTQALQPA